MTKNIWGEEISNDKEFNKWGNSVVRFKNRPAASVEKMLDDALDMTRYFKDTFDIDIHLAYGTLLGAIRDGGLIKHDDDFDVSYISNKNKIEDVILERKEICRKLEVDGYLANVVSDAHFTANFNNSYFDITLSWQEKGFYNLYYLSFETISIDKVLPLTSLNVFGRDFLAPKDSELVLADIYGASWNRPIKDFSPAKNRWEVEQNFMIFRKDFDLWKPYFSKKGKDNE